MHEVASAADSGAACDLTQTAAERHQASSSSPARRASRVASASTGSPEALPTDAEKPFAPEDKAGWVRAHLAEKPGIAGRGPLAKLGGRDASARYNEAWRLLGQEGLSFETIRLAPSASVS